jgi:hypothetical protein
MFIETEGEVSEAAGRSTTSGFDVLLDVLNQSIPPLAPYILTIMFLLCEDNGTFTTCIAGLVSLHHDACGRTSNPHVSLITAFGLSIRLGAAGRSRQRARNGYVRATLRVWPAG